MALFGVIKTDEVIFVGDKTRVDVSQSFVTPDEDPNFTLEVKPEAGAAFIPLTSSNKFLDWLYSSAGAKTITVKVNSDEFEQDIEVVELSAAKLFSDDNDLLPFEPEIMIYLPKAWSSFNQIHYRVQRQILKWLYDTRVLNSDGTRITADQILDIGEVRELASAMTLKLIFEGAKNQPGDVFSEKAEYYGKLAVTKSQAATISLDLNKSGTAVNIDKFTARLVRI